MFKKQIMKTMRITDIMADFLDSIRAYEHESGEAIYFDERESSEFVDMYFNGGGKINIEEKKPLFITEDGVEVLSDIDNLFAINLTYFSKTQNTLRSSSWLIDNPSYKVFSIESNADKYILWNKPLLSLNDIDEIIEMYTHEFEELIKLAKERIDG